MLKSYYACYTSISASTNNQRFIMTHHNAQPFLPPAKPAGAWSFGGQDETFAKREVADEVAERLAILEARDPYGCKPVRRFGYPAHPQASVVNDFAQENETLSLTLDALADAAQLTGSRFLV